MMKRTIAILATASVGLVACDKAQEPAAEAPVEPAVQKPAPEGAATETEPVEKPAPEATVATVGQPAPDFELADETGTTHKLSDLKGNIVVLEWTSTECPVVKRVYGAKLMQSAIAEVGASVKWLAVDSSNFARPEASVKWKEQNGIDWPQLQDPTGKVGQMYRAKTTPHMFVIDAEGVLRYAGAIDNDPYGKLDEKERKNYVVEAVKALNAGQPVADAETKPYGCSVKYGT